MNWRRPEVATMGETQLAHVGALTPSYAAVPVAPLGVLECHG
jgi:hypothetical protein